MIHLQDVSFTYPGADQSALRGVNLHVPAGQLCLVMGASGSGKSTLLRCINGLVPHFSGGSLAGNIRVNGLDPVHLSPREMSRQVGFVFQDPEAQFVVDRVEDEVAFALENAAIPAADIELRIESVLELLELAPLRSRRLESLSGGERQRVAIAAALALQPKILVLDEPTSQLDPSGADEVLKSLMKLNRQLGLTVVLAEHRLERVLPYTGQVIYLSAELSGGLAGEPRQVLSQVPLSPPVISLGKAFGWQPLPLTVDEARECARLQFPASPREEKPSVPLVNTEKKDRQAPFIVAQGVKVSFGDTQVLHGVDLNLYPGETTVMLGRNGAGKTTLLRALVGLIPIQAGTIRVDGREIQGRAVSELCQQVGYLPQDPNALLFADTVLEELLITLKNHRIEPSDAVVAPGDLLTRLGLADKTDKYPRDLSAGERQRVAMAAVMVTHPGALLLDEPTRGLDYLAKQSLLALLRVWREDGMAVLLVTHDVELAAQAADRVILLEGGRVIAEGNAREVLGKPGTFSPQVAKIFPGRGWITVEDALEGADGSQH